MASHIDIVHKLFGPTFRISRWYIPGVHDGIDVPAKVGTPVYAIATGKVSYAKDSRLDPHAGKAWAEYGGNVVNIDVSSRYTTQYAHLNDIVVKPGQMVQRGQLIGHVGSTGGGVTGSHSGGWLNPGANFGASNAHVHFGLWDHTTNRMIEPTAFLTSVYAGWTTPVYAGKTQDTLTSTSSPDLLATFLATIGRKPTDPIRAEDVPRFVQFMQKAGLVPAGSPTTNPLVGSFDQQVRANVGQPWTSLGPALTSSAANTFTGPLDAIAKTLGTLTDPANWVRILALFGGAIVFGVGAYGVLKATGAPVPYP
jgi:murein DD-endopeptidase MepM/ murein hydrolase activator NlpD